MGVEHGAAIGHALRIHQRGEVVPDRRGEFGLGIEQGQHAQVRGDLGEQRVEAFGGHALGQRRIAHAGTATTEIGKGGMRLGRGGERAGQGQRRQSPQRLHATAPCFAPSWNAAR